MNIGAPLCSQSVLLTVMQIFHKNVIMCLELYTVNVYTYNIYL